jgi:hypothetical protein
VAGDVILEATLDFTGPYEDGIGHALLNDVFYILDEQFHVRCATRGVRSYTRFKEGVLVIEDQSSQKDMYIDENGKKVFDEMFDAAQSFSAGRAFAKVADKWGMIDRTGRWIVEPAFSWAVPFQPNAEVTSVCLGGNTPWRLIDRQGMFVSEEFELLRAVSGGLVPFGKIVDMSMRFGIADEYGKEVIPPLYDECDDGFKSGYLGAEVANGMWGVINKTGHWTIRPKYLYVGECHDGLLLAYQGGERAIDRTLAGGKFGFINDSDQVEIKFQFDEAQPFRDGIAAVEWYSQDRNGEFKSLLGYVSANKEIIWRER